MKFNKEYLLLTPFVILLIYSAVPWAYGSAFFSARISGLPASYIPLIVFPIFVTMILKPIWRCDVRPFFQLGVIVFIFMLYGFSQFFLLTNLEGFDPVSHLKELALMGGYFLLFFSVALQVTTLSHQRTLWLFHRILFLTVFIILLSAIRYILLDGGSAIFYNLYTPLHYRYFSVMLLLFSIPILSFFWGEGKETRLIKFAFFLTLTALLVVGSRTGMIVAVMIIFFILWKKNGLLAIVRKMHKATFLLLFLVGIVAFSPQVQTRIGKLSHIKNFVALDYEAAQSEKTSIRRIGTMIGSLQVFLDHPVIGVGLHKKNLEAHFPGYLEEDFNFAKPHNTYIYFLAVSGLMGTLLFFVFPFYILFQMLATYRRNRDGYALHLASFVMGILVFMLGYQPEVGPLLWIFLGLAYGAYLNEKKQFGRIES